MMRIAWFLILLAAACPAQVPDGLETFVDGIANKVVASGESVGLSIGISKDGKTWLAKGYGLSNLELKTPVTAQTVYRIGSITKPFTAAAILLLAEDGKLSLDDPLSRFLPDYPEPGAKVTVRQLLQHTSGIKSLTSLPSYRPNIHLPLKQEDMIARFKDLPLEFEPGSTFAYSNSGYYLLGVIVEKASCTSYEDFLDERIFKVLKLEESAYDHRGKIIENRAAGYAQSWGKGGLRNADYLDMKQPFAAGSLVSTVEDLMRFMEGLAGERLLKPESLKTMTTRGVLSSGKTSPYGCGLFLPWRNGRKAYRHGGGINGFRSDLIHFPDAKITIAVLMNTEGARPERLAGQIAHRLFKDQSPEKKDE